MIPDNGQHVIIAHGYGSFTAYPCTVEVARKILSDHVSNLGSSVLNLAASIREKSNAAEFVVIADNICRALEEITTEPIGSSTKFLRFLMHGNPPSAKSGKPDERPEALVTQALRDEVVLWAFKHGLDVKKVRSLETEVIKLKPHAELSFLAPLVARAGEKPLRYVYDHDYESAQTYNQLMHGAWKETAKEHRVVENYLEFVRTLAHRDAKFDVADMQATY